MQNSIWAKETDLPRFPGLEQDLTTDVLIVGGGMAGLLCAYMLQQSGIRYALIEVDRICRGVTRNTTAKITSQHGFIYEKILHQFDADTANLYWQANEEALSRYRSMAKRIDCSFEARDNLIYSIDSPETLEREMAALEQSHIPAIYTKHVNLPISTAGAIRFQNQAQFHPLQFAAGIAGGLHIYERTAAREFAGNTVITDRGKIRAEKIIVATHFPILNKHGGYFLKQYQQRSYVLALENGPQLDGMYLDGSGQGLSLRNQGKYLLLGGGSHKTGKPGGGWEPLEAFARSHYPQAKESCRWATQDCITLDGIPYIGTYSKRTPNLYVATGFNKWGMTASMAAAMLLCDLVQDRENIYAELFSPQRTPWRKQLFCNAAEAAANLLKPTKPRCPHLGCALSWNPREHSWDCPCHGSRFSEAGKLLDNPATDDLKK